MRMLRSSSMMGDPSLLLKKDYIKVSNHVILKWIINIYMELLTIVYNQKKE